MALFLGDKFIGTNSIGTRIEEKDVNFYDYEGTLVASYTKQEALALTALPPLPDRTSENLTNEGWNWTLAEIKEQLNKMGGKLYVGCTYHTSDDKMYIYVTLYESANTFGLSLQPSTANDVTISWGDGSTDTIGTAELTTVTHTYNISRQTNLVIEVATNNGTYNFSGSVFGNYSKYVNSIKLPSNNKLLQIIGTYNFSSCIFLEKINIPYNVYVNSNYLFENCYSLKCFIFPRTSLRSQNMFYGSRIQICSISPIENFIRARMFQYCYSEVKFAFPYTVTGIERDVISYNYNQKEVRFGPNITSIGSYLLSNSNGQKNTMVAYFFSTTPPTIQATTLGDTLQVIYVPENSVSNYKSATNWSDYASIIVAIPE